MGYNSTSDAIERSFCRNLQKMPLNKITISRICNDAYISRATFYTYYDGLAELVSILENRIIEDVSAIIKKSNYFDFKGLSLGAPAPVFVDIYCYCKENEDIFKAFFGKYGDESFIWRYEKIVYKFFMDIIRQNGGMEKAELFASACAGGVIGASRTWFSHMELSTPEEMAYINTLLTQKLIIANLDAVNCRNTSFSPNDIERYWRWVHRGMPFSETDSMQ